MKRFTLALACTFALMLAPSIRPSAAGASGAAPEPAGGEVVAGDDSATGTDPAADSWRGAAAAVLCGLFVRATVASGGTSVGAIAGAVAACTYMVFDALTDRT